MKYASLAIVMAVLVTAAWLVREKLRGPPPAQIALMPMTTQPRLPEATDVARDAGVDAGVDATVAPPAPRPAALSGIVRIAGKPAAGAKVSVKHVYGFDVHEVAAVDSDGSGHYAFAGLATDPNLVVNAFYDADHGKPKSLRYPLALVAGTPATLDLDLALAASISGVVVDAHGAPVPLALLDARCDSPAPAACPANAWDEWTADEDGAFTAGGLGSGVITFTVHTPLQTTGPGLPPAKGHTLPVIPLRTAATAVKGVRLVVDRASPR